MNHAMPTLSVSVFRHRTHARQRSTGVNAKSWFTFTIWRTSGTPWKSNNNLLCDGDPLEQCCVRQCRVSVKSNWHGGQRRLLVFGRASLVTICWAFHRLLQLISSSERAWLQQSGVDSSLLSILSVYIRRLDVCAVKAVELVSRQGTLPSK